ncbi:MAG: hypothetical protein R6U85_03935 [Salinivirgaceae bacterium]
MDSQNNCIDILVKNNPVFASLNEHEIELITQNHTCSAFNKNEIIFKESERPAEKRHFRCKMTFFAFKIYLL